jgi:hypothetical protein
VSRLGDTGAAGLGPETEAGGAPRFELVVWNYERLGLFLEGFSRLRGFRPGVDRLTVVSASPGPAERALLDELAERTGIAARYLPRENRGLDQGGRCEYFTGTVGSLDENLDSRYLLQLQDHYLSPDAEASRYGPHVSPPLVPGRVKEDVIPDGAVLDLDEMEGLADAHDLDGFFCDREPCLVEWEGRRFVAPNGGNFAVRTSLVRDPEAQAMIHRLWRVFDRSSRWTLYAEFMWARIFFHEGRPFYDLARNRLYTTWPSEDFYQWLGGDYRRLFHEYDSGWAYRRARLAARRARLRLARTRRKRSRS